MDTSVGLSSIATLSLGLSMSMAGAGRVIIKSLKDGNDQLSATRDEKLTITKQLLRTSFEPLVKNIDSKDSDGVKKSNFNSVTR